MHDVSTNIFLSRECFFFMMNFQGGGWCNNVTTCLARKNTRLGSSKKMAKEIAFSGIFSNKKAFNPGVPIYIFHMDFIFFPLYFQIISSFVPN